MTRKNVRATCIMLGAWALFGALNCAARPGSSPQIHDGLLDLSSAPLGEHERLKLDGAWAFCYQCFASPQKPQEKTFVNLPGYWNEQPEKSGTTNGRGFASYRLRIILNSADRNRRLGLYVPHAFTSYRLYADGLLIAENGVPAETADLTQNKFLPEAAGFRSQNAEVEILIHVANYMSEKGGFRQSIELGTEQEVLRRKQLLLGKDLFFVGCILAVAMYHLRLFLLRRSESYALYFALCSMSLIVYRLTTGEYFLVLLFPAIPWDLIMKIFFLSMYVATPLFVTFVHNVYPEESNKRFVQFTVVAFSVLSIAVIIFDESWIEQTLIYAEILIVLACFFSLYVFLRAVLRKRDGAEAFTFGFLFHFTTIVNDILFERDLIRTEILAPVGLFALLMFHSAALLKRFTQLIVKVEEQQTELKRSAAFKEKLYRSRIKSKRMELEILKKSIQPHFLVNSLAAIRAWLVEDPGKSVSLLDDFAGEIRAMQAIVNRTSVRITEELSLCRYHLKVMGARREKVYKLYVRGVTGNETIPPLIFHTMMENAFSHLDSEKGKLSFFLLKQREVSPEGNPITLYYFAVKNVAQEGPAIRKGAGLGLRYIMTRLEESYPAAWSLDQHKSAKGHVVEIRIPGSTV